MDNEKWEGLCGTLWLVVVCTLGDIQFVWSVHTLVVWDLAHLYWGRMDAGTPPGVTWTQLTSRCLDTK